jgi:hypothetical protein
VANNEKISASIIEKSKQRKAYDLRREGDTMITTYINVFGGPGIGKSTTAADIFVKMKKKGFDVELVTEVAKDFVWEKRSATLQIQPYVTFKQYRNLIRLKGQVQYVITDAPVLLGAVYCELYGGAGWMRNAVFESHLELSPCINILLERTFDYQQNGRIQSSEEALGVDEMISKLFSNIEPYQSVSKEEAYEFMGLAND